MIINEIQTAIATTVYGRSFGGIIASSKQDGDSVFRNVLTVREQRPIWTLRDRDTLTSKQSINDVTDSVLRVLEEERSLAKDQGRGGQSRFQDLKETDPLDSAVDLHDRVQVLERIKAHLEAVQKAEEPTPPKQGKNEDTGEYWNGPLRQYNILKDTYLATQEKHMVSPL